MRECLVRSFPPGSVQSPVDETEAAISLFFHRSDRKTPNRLKQETSQHQTVFIIPVLSVNDAHLVCRRADSYYLFNKKGVLLPDWHSHEEESLKNVSAAKWKKFYRFKYFENWCEVYFVFRIFQGSCWTSHSVHSATSMLE